MNQTRQVIITSGDDWNNASFKAMNVPYRLDLEKALQEYRLWWKEKPKEDFLTFPQWLMKNYEAIDADVEIFEE